MKNSISVKVLELAIILIKFLWIGGVQRVVAICDIPAIFVFGDSLSDTGNCALSQTPSDIAFCNRTRDLPYGETFPRHGFLRFSDGLLIVDWLCMFLNLHTKTFKNQKDLYNVVHIKTIVFISLLVVKSS